MNEFGEFFLVAICAIFGYILIASILSRIDVKKNHRKEAGHGEAPKSDGVDNREQWYEILNVNPSASEDEIRAAFRTEIAKYHPDRVTHLGFEFRILAESRSKKITNAYTTGLQIRGARSR